MSFIWTAEFWAGVVTVFLAFVGGVWKLWRNVSLQGKEAKLLQAESAQLKTDLERLQEGYQNLLKAVQEELNHTRDELRKAREEIAELKGMLRASQHTEYENMQLKSKIVHLEKECEDLRKELQAYKKATNSSIRDLQKSTDELKGK